MNEVFYVIIIFLQVFQIGPHSTPQIRFYT